jgi:hypothetical protein
MKMPSNLRLSPFFLFIAAGCVVAQEFAMRGVPITVEAYVSDSEGRPVEGATVSLALPRYALGDSGQRVEAKTNANGIVSISGNAHQDYSVEVTKPGYYKTMGPHHSINTDKGLRQYASGVQKISLELRSVRSPIIGISKNVDRLQLPDFDKKLGFDLEVGDWVTPYGKGVFADLVIIVGGFFTTLDDYDQSLTLTFSHPGDGIKLLKIPPRIGSSLRFPYEAPLSGYESQRVWRKTFDGKTRTTNIDSSGETNYIIRIRTELDDQGNVRRAMYGIIDGDVVIGGNTEIGRNISFTYALNPDWTRNIEFDPAKTASSPR